MQDRTDSFGYWLRRRRKALDLTQDALAQLVFCSNFTIRKIEADERRPSRALAERLSVALAIPEPEQRAFLEAARAQHASRELRVNPLPVDVSATSHSSGSSSDTIPSSSNQAKFDSAPLVGRGSEFGLLTGCIAKLTTGAGQCVLIAGEPGIGKSRLLREVNVYAHNQLLPILATNCYEIERAVPYQPVIGLITHALSNITDTLLQSLAPVSQAELAALVPEIGDRIKELPTLSNDFPEARQARLSRAVDQLLELLRGKRPLVIMVDDIQWIDDASAQVLHFLSRQATQRPLLYIYTFRDEAIDIDDRFAAFIQSLRRDSNATHIALARLGQADTENLVAKLAAADYIAPGLAERLHSETDGNPFFLMSILQSMNEGDTQPKLRGIDSSDMLPDAIRAAVRMRLSHVPKATRQLLDNAAVLGRRFDFDTLLDVTQVSEMQLLDELEYLVKRHLLREESEVGNYDFSHDKVREVVYRDISAVRRRSLHRSVAEYLENHPGQTSHERDAQLAEHYERAQLWSKALHYLVLAAEHSQKLFAMRDALHWLDRAIAVCDSHPEATDSQQPNQHLSIYQLRGAARAQAGQTQGAVADIRRVIDTLRSEGEREQTRDMLIQLGMAYRRADQYDQATACLTEALKESRLMNDEYHAADTLYHLGTVAWSNGKNHQAINYHQQAVEICEHTGCRDLIAVQAFHGRGEAHYADTEPAAAINCYTRSLQLARGIGDKSYESENLMMIGHAYIGSKGHGDYPRAIANFEAALSIARAADLQWHFGPTLLGLDHARACTGEYGQAWLGIQKTLPWLESLKQVRYQFIAIDCIGHLLLDLGLNELAIEHMLRGHELSLKTGILFWCAAIQTHLAVAQNRLGEKVDTTALQSTLEKTRQSSERYMQVRCLEGLAEIALANGDINGCLHYADQLLTIATTNELRELQAVARHWRGKAKLAEQDYLTAHIELTTAAELANQIGRVRLQFDTQLSLAKLCSEQNKTHAAQNYFDQAHKLQQIIENSLLGTDLKAELHIL